MLMRGSQLSALLALSSHPLPATSERGSGAWLHNSLRPKSGIVSQEPPTQCPPAPGSMSPLPLPVSPSPLSPLPDPLSQAHAWQWHKAVHSASVSLTALICWLLLWANAGKVVNCSWPHVGTAGPCPLAGTSPFCSMSNTLLHHD
jgi:hypothetical protein